MTIRQSDNKLVGVGVFFRRWGATRLPFPHWETYRSPHTFGSGILVDANTVDESLEAFWRFVRRPGGTVAFRDLPTDTAIWDALQDSARRCGIKWLERQRIARACVKPASVDYMYPVGVLSKRMLSKIRKNREKLACLGTPAYRVIPADEEAVNRFLHLEHMGWKGEQGTSLRATPGHERFFRAVVNQFSTNGRAFFSELLLGQRVIGSTIHFLSGRESVVFKLGWDTEFAECTPGLIEKIDFVANAARDFPGLDTLDGCAEPGSFLDSLFPNRRQVATGFFTGSELVRRLVECTTWIRNGRDRWRQRRFQRNRIQVDNKSAGLNSRVSSRDASVSGKPTDPIPPDPNELRNDAHGNLIVCCRTDF